MSKIAKGGDLNKSIPIKRIAKGYKIDTFLEKNLRETLFQAMKQVKIYSAEFSIDEMIDNLTGECFICGKKRLFN